MTKSISEIPKGDYCYEWIEVPSKENHYHGKRRMCPHFDWRTFPEGHEYAGETYAYCYFLQDHDFILLDDHVKICSENEWPDEDFID